MTFRQFALNNVIRNKRLYAAYFLSSMFTVMVFFTFAIFAFHPAFGSGSINWKALYGMGVAGGVIYIFSFFFVLYSMSSFLQSRKKEFGLLMMQGMATGQIRLMVFLENMLIGFFATLSGIILGLVFAKVILLLAENVLIIDESLNFYFPVLAIIVTFISFIVLFLFISLFVSFILRTRKLIDLIKADKQSKGEPKASRVLAIAAAILLIGGYAVALYVKGMYVLFAMIPVIIVVIIGTYLLFTQLSVYIIRRLKRNKGIFWRKTNMLLFSDLSFRMKDNARTFFMVAIISTVAFSAIGSLFGFQSYLTSGMKEANPFTYTYTAYQDDPNEQLKEDVQYVTKVLREEGVKADSEKIDLQYFQGPDDREVLIVKASGYNRFAAMTGKKQVDPGENEAIVVIDNNSNIMNEKREQILMETPIELEDGSKVQPYSMIASNALPEMYAYYIVNDNVFDMLPKSEKRKTFVAWKAEQGQNETVLEAGKTLMEESEPGKFQAMDYIIYRINKSYGPILFIGLFIGIVFFVSAGSFLYFRLHTDLDNDKTKFRSIAKMGLTDAELKKVINRQTVILFFAPIIVALIHGAVALTALSHFFDFNLVRESALVLGSFALIQIIYFVIVRHFYAKQIRVAVR